MTEDIQFPKLYNIVFFYNDSISEIFLTKIMEVILDKNSSQSKEVIYNLKKNGKEIVGTFNKEIAETKKAQILYNCEINNFSLVCDLESID